LSDLRNPILAETKITQIKRPCLEKEYELNNLLADIDNTLALKKLRFLTTDLGV
jgi:hypothetical protein